MTEHYQEFVAQADHIDELEHVNNAVWVQWIQELATAHWNAVAPKETIEKYIWVVTRHEIDYRGNIAAGEIAIGRTWVSERPKGARFWRNFSFADRDGKQLVSGRTNWAIIDRAIERPVRVPADLVDLFLSD